MTPAAAARSPALRAMAPQTALLRRNPPATKVPFLIIGIGSDARAVLKRRNPSHVRAEPKEILSAPPFSSNRMEDSAGLWYNASAVIRADSEGLRAMSRRTAPARTTPV